MGKVIFPGEKRPSPVHSSTSSGSGEDDDLAVCGCLFITVVIGGIILSVYGWIQYHEGYLSDDYYIGLWVLTIIVGLVSLFLLAAILSDG